LIGLTGSLSSIRDRETFGRAQALKRTWPLVMDLCIAAIGLACFYGVVRIAHYWMGHAEPEIVISLSPRALPLYAFYSVVRIGLAYVISFFFAVGYGYVAAHSRRLEPLMVAGLDICQSIPVLSFLPGVMLAMMALFPTRQIGVEMGAILLIFTGEVWNMAFSFYSSIKSIPRELNEAATIYRFSRWQRLLQLELPYGAIGLVWNSMVSVAGGWFFLMACEMFVLGSRDFRLPGLGSYLQTAASNSNTGAIIMGLSVMIGIIVAIDQLIWRPAIAWSNKFKFEQVESATRTRSPILHLLTHSGALHSLRQHTLLPISEKIYCSVAERRKQRMNSPAAHAKTQSHAWLRWAVVVVFVIGVVYLASEALVLLRRVHTPQLEAVLRGAVATFLRMNVSLLIAAAWTIPVGVAIGFNSRLTRIAQPLAQIAASVPATALFPIILLALIRMGGGMGIASILLMLMGTQWFILFNVVAGAMAIPSDLREVAQLFHFTRWQHWRTVILPAISPFLITGMVTASGGAWNASIIAEYFHLNNQTMQTVGLGAQISSATDRGEFHLLLLSTIVMALMVVTINRLVWRPLFRLSETRFKLEG